MVSMHSSVRVGTGGGCGGASGNGTVAWSLGATIGELELAPADDSAARLRVWIASPFTESVELSPAASIVAQVLVLEQSSVGEGNRCSKMSEMEAGCGTPPQNVFKFSRYVLLTARHAAPCPVL